MDAAQRRSRRSEAMNIDRTDLYRLIWAMPAVRLGELLGISGTAVLKACKRRSVPVPGRGYWTKIQHGQSRARLPLPTSEAKHLLPIVVSEPRAAALQEVLAGMRDDAERDEGQGANVMTFECGMPQSIDATGLGRSASETQSRPADKDPFTTESRGDHAIGDCAEEWPRGFDAAMGAPTAASLSSLARQLEVCRLIREVVAEVERRRSVCDASTSAVLALWLREAEEIVGNLDPVPRIFEACRAALECRDGRWRWWESP